MDKKRPVHFSRPAHLSDINRKCVKPIHKKSSAVFSRECHPASLKSFVILRIGASFFTFFTGASFQCSGTSGMAAKP